MKAPEHEHKWEADPLHPPYYQCIANVYCHAVARRGPGDDFTIVPKIQSWWELDQEERLRSEEDFRKREASNLHRPEEDE